MTALENRIGFRNMKLNIPKNNMIFEYFICLLDT